MNKNKIKLLIIMVLTIFCITNVNALSLLEHKNESTGYRVTVEDDANLLAEEELKNLQDEMMGLTEYGHVAFKTISENYTTPSSYASDYYHEKFGTDSGTLLLIDMDNRYIYIFSDGDNYNIITTAKANIITDNIYQYATDGDYYTCASMAFSQINTLLNGGKISEPMRHISNILIALTLAFLINFIIVLVNTKIKKAKANEILKNCSIEFNIDEVKARKTGTHSVYSPQDTSSSGGGSSGGGGGGSSGGGGGHSF